MLWQRGERWGREICSPSLPPHAPDPSQEHLLVPTCEHRKCWWDNPSFTVLLVGRCPSPSGTPCPHGRALGKGVTQILSTG